MAQVFMQAGYADLQGWPGQLLDGAGPTTVTTQTATEFSFRHDPGHSFEDFTITVQGSGFGYDAGEPVSGTMSRITIRDPMGDVVLIIDNLAAGTLASDLNLFYANVFGWNDPDGNPQGAQVKNAWSQILRGNDVITGTSGNDWRGFPGVNAGNDRFDMGAGDDVVLGGLGNDTINGGDGFDTYSFEETHWNEGIPMQRGLSVNMTTGVVQDAYGFTDQINSIEQVIGSSYADLFLGSAGEDHFSGGRGRDTLNGGDGRDWAKYDEDQWRGAGRGIVADLEVSVAGGSIQGKIRDGFGNTDVVIDIECVRGTRYNDVFVGSSELNNFIGGNGKDRYDGQGGDDFIFFGIDFAGAPQTGVTVDLSRANNQVVNDGFGNAETAINIEGVFGGGLNDRIKGAGGFNHLAGGDGTDTLTGGGGNDNFEWWDRAHMDDADLITDFRQIGANADHLVFDMTAMGASTVLTLVNGSAATAAVSTFVFDATTATLYWDEDGTGAGAALAVAVLTGVTSLALGDFDLN